MSIIKAIAFAAFVIAIPLFLIIMNLRVVVNTPLLYSYGFDQYEIERVTGIERSDLISAGKKIRDYFNNEERWLNVQVPIQGGEPKPLYNTTELLHMWDVKVLIRTLYNVQLIVGLYIVLFIPAGLATAPRAFPRILMRLIAWGAGLTLAIVFITGLLSLTGFSQTFYTFHVIAFTNDLWKLDPARDYLIAMFPEGFFFDATMVLASLTVIQGLWIFCLSMSALKRLSASLFFKLTVVQTLSVVAAAVFILRVYPDGFFFEAVMIVVVASVAQALVALVAWRRAPSKATSASALKNGEGSASRSASSSVRSQKKSEQQQGSERTESLADSAILGYYVIEAVLLLLIPVIHEWRSARRVEASSGDTTR
ncbi:MAG: TIGR01906 family membrane protein [Chloroflexota bacterium]|nr:TIGR01906 family membrane protein [Chloroflexota bacterium]